ncbi:MAG: metallophosphoesterase [Sulfurovum sp.]|nr:metallophosphoesterase [Sulfurovum sp.]
MKNIIFVLLFLVLIFSLHYLFYSRVIKKTIVSNKRKTIFSLLLAINYIFNILYVFSLRYSEAVPKFLFYLFSISLGVSFVILMYLIINEILNIFNKTLKSFDYSKREFIKKGGDGTLLAFATSYIAVGAYNGNKEPVVNTIKLNNFDFSIVQISDFHIAGLIDKKFVEKSVDKINKLKPDIVCITGDLTDTDISKIQDSVKALENIKTKYGIYYILGNHEYFHNPEKIIEHMKATNITLLLNENIQIDALKLNIVGVTDIIGYRMGLLEPDIHKAFVGSNQNYKTILLTHQPKFIEELGTYKPELILSGHTHGGQIQPFNYLVRLQQPYIKGLHLLPNGSHIYVNSGIGFWGPPMRLGSHAEIAYIV